MLNKETSDQLKKSIKEINKEKEVSNKLTMMIDLKEQIRNQFNEYLDDMFAEVNLLPRKVNLDEEDYLNH